jgi:hypothetical protein
MPSNVSLVLLVTSALLLEAAGGGTAPTRGSLLFFLMGAISLVDGYC